MVVNARGLADEERVVLGEPAEVAARDELDMESELPPRLLEALQSPRAGRRRGLFRIMQDRNIETPALGRPRPPPGLGQLGIQRGNESWLLRRRQPIQGQRTDGGDPPGAALLGLPVPGVLQF